MKVLVTGYSGFIGRNLIYMLEQKYPGIAIYKFNSRSSPYEMDEYTKDCEFVFHLAAIHRPKDENEFSTINHGLTAHLIGCLEKHNNKCPILYTSSIQAGNGSAYGDSKTNAENCVIEHSRRTGSRAIIYRLTNTFGKWARPNGHSVVATFCNNIKSDIPITVSDRDHQMNLYYIDDVVESFIERIEDKPPYTDDMIRGLDKTLTYTVTLGKIADLLYYFNNCYRSNTAPTLANDFERKLYTTFLSY